jgi:acetyl-CoA carboxylase carboxyl transferase subunit alpha
MKTSFLDFEQPIAELEQKIDSLRFVQDDAAVDIADEIQRLQKKADALVKETYSKLSPWQVTQVARHPQRPYTLDYINLMFTDFHELHGDRAFADDRAIVGGLARFNGQAVMVIGHQKGHDTKEKVMRNFGMPRPEGYRKAMRLMDHADRFRLPIIRFIDTPGAYAGVLAEELGQGEAIAVNLREMFRLRVPIIATVIGEGGSGGALGIGVADRLLMFEHSVYTVASPEACASILWRDASKAPVAAEALKITAADLLRLGLIDAVLPEPSGGNHWAPLQAAETLRVALLEQLADLKQRSEVELIDQRYAKFRRMGQFLDGGVLTGAAAQG